MNVFGIAGFSAADLKRCEKRGRLGARLLASAALMIGTLTMPVLGVSSAFAAEHSLAGIRIFASVRDVLNKYGDPNQILTGAAAQGSGAGGAGGQYAANPYGGGNGGGQIGMVPPLQFGGGLGAPPSMGPGGPGAGMMNGGAPGNGSTAGAAAPPGEVQYVYNRPNGVTFQFLLSPDGRVIQITVLGYKASIVTERGVSLGTNYGKVVAKYGYPEGQDNNGTALTMTYLAHNHVSFVLKNERVVGITVAAIE
jgi:hypothetical protein